MTGKKILIVEDDPIVIGMYLQFFKILQADTIPLAACSYTKAREILSKESVDLIILDLMLPDVLATDILGELTEDYPEIPIFLVTGHPESVDRETLRRFGVNHLFFKPVHLKAFCRAVQDSLDKPGWSGRPFADTLH
jgi:response regulator of citrate/malate metabolism